ncbi:hypothetical protein [Streptomyces sp. NPDC056491]|uniref:hypothetical protein n=1 Tax=Streptomyces sp. NPDC056491 TaxID=3345837 RepID=UPI0036B8DAB6
MAWPPVTRSPKISGARTQKTGGYWYASKGALSEGEPDTNRWARIDIGAAYATITI